MTGADLAAFLTEYHRTVDARIAALPFEVDKRFPADRRGTLNCNMGAGRRLREARAARGLHPLTGTR